ncbi:MAG: hypothetical protein ACXWG0_01655 [Chthoniobacterales bacterium]
MRRALIAAIALFLFAGCNTKSGEAVVVDKEFIAAATEETKSNEHVLDHDQWIVKVQMLADMRRVDVHIERPEYDRIKVGDHLHVTYHQGKYTGTIWGAEIH